MKRSLLILFLLETFGLLDFAQAQTWSQVFFAQNNYCRSVASSADGMNAVAIQDDALHGKFGIYKSTNSGSSWFLTAAPTNIEYGRITMSADGSRLAATTIGNKGIFNSTNGGATWTQNTTNGYWLNLVSSANGMLLAALTNDANFVLCTSTNAGATWIKRDITNQAFTGWESLAMSADGQIIVGQVLGATYRSTNSGASFYQLVLAPHYTVSSVPSQNLAVSADGTKITAAYVSDGQFSNSSPKPCTIFLSTNSGASWMQTSAPSNFWSTVSMSADGTKIVVASSGFGVGSGPIFTSNDSGFTWISNSLPNQYWTSIAISADRGKVLAGSGYLNTTGAVFTTYSPQNFALSLAPTNSQLKLSWVMPSTNLLLQRSSDLKSWSAITNPPALNTDNLQNELMIPAANGSQFFRLATP